MATLNLSDLPLAQGLLYISIEGKSVDLRSDFECRNVHIQKSEIRFEFERTGPKRIDISEGYDFITLSFQSENIKIKSIENVSKFNPPMEFYSIDRFRIKIRNEVVNELEDGGKLFCLDLTKSGEFIRVEILARNLFVQYV